MTETILSTIDDSIINTAVSDTSRLLTDDDGDVTLDGIGLGGVTVVEGYLPIFSTTGIPIFSTTGIPLHAAVVTKKKESDLSEYTVVGESLITISWDQIEYDRYNLECCAYWLDNQSYKVGSTYGHGSIGNDNYGAYWTGSTANWGPEYIALLTTSDRRCSAESSPYQYRVHLNFYGNPYGSTNNTATVTVDFGATTLSKTIYPSTNTDQPATPSDPFVTITFAADGTPTSIN